MFLPRRERAFGTFGVKKRNRKNSEHLKQGNVKTIQLLQCVVLPGPAGKLLFEGLVFCILRLRGSWVAAQHGGRGRGGGWLGEGRSTLRTQRGELQAARCAPKHQSRDWFTLTELPEQHGVGCFEIPVSRCQGGERSARGRTRPHARAAGGAGPRNRRNLRKAAAPAAPRWPRQPAAGGREARAARSRLRWSTGPLRRRLRGGRASRSSEGRGHLRPVTTPDADAVSRELVQLLVRQPPVLSWVTARERDTRQPDDVSTPPPSGRRVSAGEGLRASTDVNVRRGRAARCDRRSLRGHRTARPEVPRPPGREAGQPRGPAASGFTDGPALHTDRDRKGTGSGASGGRQGGLLTPERAASTRPGPATCWRG